MDNIQINRIPSPTWNRLGVNHAALTLNAQLLCPARPVMTDGNCRRETPAEFSVPGSAGPAFEQFIASVIPVAEQFSSLPEDTLILRDLMTAGQARRLHLRAARGSRLILLSRYQTSPDPAHLILEEIRILAEPGSHVSVVQILDGDEQDRIVTSLGADAGNGSKIDVTQIVLGGSENYLGGNILLRGTGCSLDAAVNYLCCLDHVLDMNWTVIHSGEKTNSRINAQGILNDRSRKVFRGTIEFLKGASGSVGDETEDVMLLSDEVRNQTVPVILCSEENVQGNHGASIGRLSDELLYYLQSRGPDREDVIRILTAARLLSAIRRIPDEETVRWLRQRLSDEET